MSIPKWESNVVKHIHCGIKSIILENHCYISFLRFIFIHPYSINVYLSTIYIFDSCDNI